LYSAYKSKESLGADQNDQKHLATDKKKYFNNSLEGQGWKWSSMWENGLKYHAIHLK